MKRIAIALLVLSASTVFAGGLITTDNNKTPIQGFAPNGRNTQSLAVTSSTVDMRQKVAWSAYAPADCKYRIMSTATKRGTQGTIVGGSWHTRVVNAKSAYTNFSGCTSGVLELQ